MVQGSYNRREVTSRRVEYVIETPHGEPVEGKTLGVVLANVNRELGDRVQDDAAYRIRGEDGRVVIEFDVELTGGPLLAEGEEVMVQTGGLPASARTFRRGRVVRAEGDDVLQILIPADED